MIIGHSNCEKGLYTIYQTMTITNGDPYQSEKFAASLPQTCSTLFSAPEKLRNSVQKCAASGTLLAHNRLCATESKLCARTRIVCEKCATIYS